MNLTDTLQRLFLNPAPTVSRRNPHALAISKPITDDGMWDNLITAPTNRLFGRAGPADRTWTSLAADMDDALEAWRKNFLIRQVVRLTTAYVVGDGIQVKAKHPHAASFTLDFWTHRHNHLASRLPAWCDELTRSGELFLLLFTNPLDGMSYVRAIPARTIQAVETHPDDYELETGYLEQTTLPGPGDCPPFTRRWLSKDTAPYNQPMMLHYAINRPVGATRGESDLTPILPWAMRYTDWLKDRVRFNTIRTEMAAAWIKVADETTVSRKRLEYEANPPIGGNIFITGPGEELSFPAASIEAGNAEPDGKAIRLAVAAGANIPLHFLAEGSSATRSTAEQMGDPTRRHYRMRQLDFAHILCDITEQAFVRRAMALRHTRHVNEPGIFAEMPDVSREDNQALATSAYNIVQAFAIMQQQGWIDRETAIPLAFKFAGEILTEEQIAAILAHPVPPAQPATPPTTVPRPAVPRPSGSGHQPDDEEAPA